MTGHKQDLEYVRAGYHHPSLLDKGGNPHYSTTVLRKIQNRILLLISHNIPLVSDLVRYLSILLHNTL